MTVALGLVCADGVIVASDSMASSVGDVAMESVKVYGLSNAKVVWTAAGSVYTIEEVQASLEELDSKIDLSKSNPETRAVIDGDKKQLRDKVGTQRIAKTIGNVYQQALPHGPSTVIPGTATHPFSASFLLLAWTASGPHFLEVSEKGEQNWHTSRGFYAVGSGGPFATVAQGLMNHYLEGEPLPVEKGLQIAYRAIDTTCQVSSSGVGLGVQLAVADQDGARVLVTDELEEVKTGVARWKQLERDILRDSRDPDPEALPELIDLN